MTLENNNYYRNMMWAALPLVVCGCVLYGARVLILVAAAALFAIFADVVTSMIRHTDYDPTDKSSVASAVIFTLMLPVNIPFYIVGVSVLIAVFVGKHIFGGKEVYPFNLSALAICIAAVNWQQKVFSAVTPFSKVSLISGETANVTISNAAIIKAGGVPTTSTFDLLLGNYAGSMGSNFVLVMLVVLAALILTKKINWQIPVTFLVTCAVIAYIFPRIYGFSRFDSVKFEMLNGAVIFTALFMLCEPSTTPRSPKAKILFGFLAGVLGMIFRYVGSFEIGTCFALLLLNTLDEFIERLVSEKKIKRAIQLIGENINGIKENKHIYKKEPAAAESAPEKKKSTMELISETEDNIDNVIYSTRTLDRNQILAMEQELLKQRAKNKKGKADK